MRLSRRLPIEDLPSLDATVIENRLKDLLQVYVNHDGTDFPLQRLCRPPKRIDPGGTIDVSIGEMRLLRGQMIGRLKVTAPIIDPSAAKTEIVETELSVCVSLDRGEIEID